MILRNRSLLVMSSLLSSLYGGSFVQSAATSSASGSSSTPTVHKVVVGSNGFTYSPNTTFANVGDIVTFEFLPTNHSVIRSEYTAAEICGSAGCNPCVPYELIHPGQPGFFSGNSLTQDADPNTAPSWNLTINTTEPIFFYCDALTSCHPNGMVGVINPNSSTSLDKQYEAAVNAPYELAPGQPFPAEGGGSMNNTAPSPYPSTNANSGSGGSHLSGGAIAGIVIAGVAVLLLAAALFYFVGRNKSYRDIIHGKSSSTQGGGQGSQVGDMGPWSPAGPLTPGQQYDNRFSGTTAYSQMQGPTAGTFVGYNRQTGAPEFAAEAPDSPQPLPSGFSPHTPQPGTFVPNKHQSVELPGDAPGVAEKGAGEKQN